MSELEISVGAETDTVSPVLFEDSPSSSPVVSGADVKVEVFGTSPEEAVREMRFRIEQKTTLTASAGNTKSLFICSGHNMIYKTVLMDFVSLLE